MTAVLYTNSRVKNCSLFGFSEYFTISPHYAHDQILIYLRAQLLKLLPR